MTTWARSVGIKITSGEHELNSVLAMNSQQINLSLKGEVLFFSAKG